MDYYKIGQRIRKFRKAQGISQEQLAETVGISTTHMSHIETGNTKLSLAVFADLAIALEVRTDELLFDIELASKTTALNEIAGVLEGCSAAQSQVIKDIVVASKVSMDKYL